MTRLTDCIDCIAGKYVAATGSDQAGVCFDCAVGKYQNRTTQTSCIECEDGKFANETVTVNCKKCPVGFFNDKAAYQVGQAVKIGGSNFIVKSFKLREMNGNILVTDASMQSRG